MDGLLNNILTTVDKCVCCNLCFRYLVMFGWKEIVIKLTVLENGTRTVSSVTLTKLYAKTLM